MAVVQHHKGLKVNFLFTRPPHTDVLFPRRSYFSKRDLVSAGALWVHRRIVPDDPPEALAEYHIMTMADETTPHISLNVPQPRPRRQSATSSVRSSSAEDNSPSSKISRRRQLSPTSNHSSHTRLPSDRLTRPRSSKSTSREGNPQHTTIAMPSVAASAGEITYTPTTHRISKAKKGKKVHACEHPGCTKVWTLHSDIHSSC